MKEEDRVNILILFFSIFLLKIWKNLELENLFFQMGVEIHPHLVLKGLNSPFELATKMYLHQSFWYLFVQNWKVGLQWLEFMLFEVGTIIRPPS